MTQIFRKECKYMVTTGEFIRFKKSLNSVLKPDNNGKQGCYKVRSLYFDSLYDNDYYDSIEGIYEKRKIRLRLYPPHFEYIRLEWKCKAGSDGVKYVQSIGREEAEKMMGGDYNFLATQSDPFLQNLYIRLKSGGYRPKALVEYEREVYGYAANEVRITFDTYMKGTLTGKGFFEEKPMLIPLMDYGKGILEIKYNHFLPDPIKRLTGKIDRLQVANSKYVQVRNLM